MPTVTQVGEGVQINRIYPAATVYDPRHEKVRAEHAGVPEFPRYAPAHPRTRKRDCEIRGAHPGAVSTLDSLAKRCWQPR